MANLNDVPAFLSFVFFPLSPITNVFLFSIQFSPGFGQAAKPGGSTSKRTCYLFVNDSKEIRVRNRWVTLFPPRCCLPGIHAHPCRWKAHHPSAPFSITQTPRAEMLICPLQRSGEGLPSRPTPVNVARGAATRGQDIYPACVISTGEHHHPYCQNQITCYKWARRRMQNHHTC